MKRKIDGFVEAIRNKKVKAAHDELEKLQFENSDFDRGYRLALEGMVNAMNGNESPPPPLIVRLVGENGNAQGVLASRWLEEFEERTRVPLSEDERGFVRAWIDVLEKFFV